MSDSLPQVWGGIAYLPSHPAADMHGLVRVVVCARKKHAAVQALKRYGIKEWIALQVSKSQVEIAVADPSRFLTLKIRSPWVAPVALAYIRTENYVPLIAHGPILGVKRTPKSVKRARVLRTEAFGE